MVTAVTEQSLHNFEEKEAAARPLIAHSCFVITALKSMGKGDWQAKLFHLFAVHFFMVLIEFLGTLLTGCCLVNVTSSFLKTLDKYIQQKQKNASSVG